MRLVITTFMILVICTSFTLSSVGAEQTQTYTMNSQLWIVQYTISATNVVPNQVVIVQVTFTPKIRIYDFSLQPVTNPVSLVTGRSMSFEEIDPGLPQIQTFQVTIPGSATTGTKYQLDLQLQGYNDTAKVDVKLLGFRILYWRYQSYPWMPESPEYVQDTNSTLGQSIVITVS